MGESNNRLAAQRMRMWSTMHPECDTQGITEDEWLGLAEAAVGPVAEAWEEECTKAVRLSLRNKELEKGVKIKGDALRSAQDAIGKLRDIIDDYKGESNG